MSCNIPIQMELLNVIIDFHIDLNELAKYKQAITVLVNGGIISRYVPEFDLYVHYRRQNERGVSLQIVDPIRDSNGILFPSEIRIFLCYFGEPEIRLYWFRERRTMRCLHNDTINSKGLTCPALVDNNGFCKWYKNGSLHRDDVDDQGKTLPALSYSGGDMYWYNRGVLHNTSLDDDGNLLPAAMLPDGTVRYYINGIRLKDNRNPIPYIKIHLDGIVDIPDEYVIDIYGTEDD
jgi:hypothetical protein